MPEKEEDFYSILRPRKRAKKAGYQERLKSLLYMMWKGSFSDFTIICGDTRFPVHRAVLSASSSFFERACFGKFREAQDCEMVLNDQEPRLIQAMIEFIYTGEYSVPSCPKKELIADHDTFFHLSMYFLADFIELEDMQDFSENHLHTWSHGNPDPRLFEAVVERVYASTPKGSELRRLLVFSVFANKTTPAGMLTLAPGLKGDFFENNAEFARDLLAYAFAVNAW